MKKQFTLGKNERLKSRKLIEQVFGEGKKFTMASFRVHYLFGAGGTFPLRFGAGVSNKNFKKAVDRNRIKRLAREAWRQQKSVLQQRLKEKNESMDVFFIYTGKELSEFKIVYDAIGKAINKLCGIIDLKK